VIEAFPEDKLFNYSVGGMRTFAILSMELLGMATPTLKGVVSRKWDTYKTEDAPKTKKDLLVLWDKATQELNELWPQIPEGRFQEDDVAFGMYAGKIYWTMLYIIDNEVHHRAQGYVYLRSLGIEPPPFWER
jgi:uncharacterized damage-inducible protein DinB